jgi:serine/threonine protein kinase
MHPRTRRVTQSGDQRDDSPPVTPGQILAGKYRVERLLGAGAMGMVVAAVQLALNRRVALKVLLPGAKTTPEHEDRFLREARIAAMPRSQHVAAGLDVGMLEDGSPYIVMEYLDGQDLFKRIMMEPPTPLGELRPGVPAGLWAAIARALEKERDQRWQSVRAFAEAIPRPRPTATPRAIAA